MPDDAYDPATLAVLAGMEPRRRPAGFVEDRHPVEDGPGSGTRVELSVRVLVGLERSTVIVGDPISGRPLAREVIPHGREADVAAAAVEAAIRSRVKGEPGGVAEGSGEPLGKPRE
ncbi:MAG: hypothetical protein INR70_25940 [Parafilimonas terrae]|nr:hypothetical protein [Parafilimonas terrae]